MKTIDTFAVYVATTSNKFFVWEIEDSSVKNVADRIAPRIKGLDLEQLEITKLTEEVKA